MNYKIINIETINQYMMGNKELVKQLLDLYIVQSPLDFEALEKAIEAKDRSLIREKAHHIKPTMQYIGANGLLNDFQILEYKAKQDNNIEDLLGLFNTIKPKFQLMLQELNSLTEEY